MSQIKQILSTLASASVSAGATTVTGLAQGTLKVSGLECPVRVLTLLRESGVQVASFTYGANAAMKAVWTVHDLLLWRPVGLDTELADLEGALTDYMAGVIDWARANRTPGSSAGAKAVIEVQSMTPGVFEWPTGSGNQFYGVDTALTVYEVI